MSTYDYQNERIKLTRYAHAGRALRYWVERIIPHPRTATTIEPPAGELLLGFGFCADQVRVWTVSNDLRFDGISDPTCCVGGLLIDPRSVREMYPTARYHHRCRVWPWTRRKWRRLVRP